MARVTADEVKAIMDNCTVEDSVVDVFIGAATALIDKVFSGDTTLGDTLLKEIERYYTAHMMATTVCRTASDEKVGDASVKYTGKWDLGLDASSYGQIVKQLDCTGKMANLSKKAASIFAVTSFE